MKKVLLAITLAYSCAQAIEKQKEVTSLANCMACHTKADKGSYSERENYSKFWKKDMDFFEDVHELFSNAFTYVIFLHIAGVALDKVLRKSKAFDSMLDGYKDGDGESVKLTILQKLFGVLWISSSVALLVYLLFTPSNFLIADANKAVNYKMEHELFQKEYLVKNAAETSTKESAFKILNSVKEKDIKMPL